MTVLLALSALAQTPPPPPRKERWRIALPPMDVGHGVFVRAGWTPAATIQFGVEPFRHGRFSGRFGIQTGTAQLIQDFSRTSGWIDRRFMQTNIDGSLRFAVGGGLHVEAVGGLNVKNFRQQWANIDTVSSPIVGGGLQWSGKWVGVRIRSTVDLFPTKLIFEDWEQRDLSLVNFEGALFFRFPGTRDPFRNLPTLHK